MVIALYGINNIGKSTQAEMLLARLSKEGQSRHIKFPIYDLEPTGPLINEYLRKGNPYNLTPREAQLVYIQNRIEFAPTLTELRGKTHLILEDYAGTGIAWGIGAGVDKELLVRLNSTLPKPDVNILLDGERFIEAKEKGHVHEENDVLMAKVRKAHIMLGKEFGWQAVDANATKEEVHEEIWHIVEKAIAQ